MNLKIPNNQSLERYLHYCSEQERLQIFRQAHYEKDMFSNEKDKKIFQEIDRVMRRMGYRHV